MSIPVSLQDLPTAVAAREAGPFLMTVGATGPRATSVVVESNAAAGTFTMEVGRRTADNIGAQRRVALLWPADPSDPDHALLVDGEAVVDGRLALLKPSSAIKHVLRTG